MAGLLHIYDPAIAHQLISEMLAAGDARFQDLAAGNERAGSALSAELAYAMGDQHPTFDCPGIDLTSWEAQIDRGIGMLIRPPARIFIDAGVPRGSVLAMPIRIDPQGEMMAGAWVPPETMPRFAEHFDTHLERNARRVKDAERDPYAVLDVMTQAIHYAQERGLGLLESCDVAGPAFQFVGPRDRKRMPAELRRRIDSVYEVDKQPGILRRMFRRGNQ